jgi:hypothetical protein
VRFTWLEAACVISIALAALNLQTGERGARHASASASSPKAVIVAGGEARKRVLHQEGDR